MDARRTRTPDELTKILRVLRERNCENFAWLAWYGFNEEGRGLVWVSRETGATYLGRSAIVKQPAFADDRAELLGLIDRYDPDRQVVVVFLLTATATLAGEYLHLLWEPPPPPPHASRR
jgi:hypothetical protein